MGQEMRCGRRRFLMSSAALLGAGEAGQLNSAVAPVRPSSGGGETSLRMRAEFDLAQVVWILVEPEAGFKEQLAARELARGLRNLGLAREPVLALVRAGEPASKDFVFVLEVNREAFQHPEAYEITRTTESGKAPRVRVTGATPQAVLYAVFDFLERQGAFFGLDGEVYPLEPARALNLPLPDQPWRAQPRFKVRGLVPWPDFLNCITVFNREDYRAYLEAMLRMRFNTLGIHVYSGANQWAESFLSFEYGGVGHLAFTDTSATHRWGYLPERTSRYGMGAAGFFDGETFGSEATAQARDPWEAAERARELWREAFRYARELGIHTGVGFEPYQIPDEILRATPPEARYEQQDSKAHGSIPSRWQRATSSKRDSLSSSKRIRRLITSGCGKTRG